MKSGARLMACLAAVVATAAGGLAAASSAAAVAKAPAIAGISPARGPVAGGNQVAIVGSGFSSASRVSFDGVASPHVVLESASRLVAQAPRHGLSVVHIRVTTGARTSAVTDADRYRYVTAPTMKWPFPPTLLRDSDASDDLSCPTTSFCLAVGYGSVHGAASRTYRGAAGWGTSQVAGAHRLTHVSCASSTFCAAVGVGGRTGIYDGSHWKYLHDHADLGDLTAVSCSSSTFCMATDGRTMLRWTGRTWQHTAVGSPTTLYGVSCTSSRYCLAVSSHGYRTVWSGSRWSGFARFAHVTTLAPPVVDCATPNFCAVALPVDPSNERNTVVIKHGSTYSPQISSVTPTDVGDVGVQTDSVSCPSDDLCAIGTNGGEGEPSRILLFTSAAGQPKTDTSKGAYAPGNDHVSCPTVHVCVGIGLSRSYRGNR